LTESLKHTYAKFRGCIRVVEEAQASTPNPGHRISPDRLFLGFFIDRERRKIGLRGAVPEFDIQDREKKGFRAPHREESCNATEPDTCDAGGFACKPAARPQEMRRDRSFEGLAFTAQQ
jgi:hypothetical protein